MKYPYHTPFRIPFATLSKVVSPAAPPRQGGACMRWSPLAALARSRTTWLMAPCCLEKGPPGPVFLRCRLTHRYVLCVRSYSKGGGLSRCCRCASVGSWLERHISRRRSALFHKQWRRRRVGIGVSRCADDDTTRRRRSERQQLDEIFFLSEKWCGLSSGGNSLPCRRLSLPPSEERQQMRDVRIA